MFHFVFQGRDVAAGRAAVLCSSCSRHAVWRTLDQIRSEGHSCLFVFDLGGATVLRDTPSLLQLLHCSPSPRFPLGAQSTGAPLTSLSPFSQPTFPSPRNRGENEGRVCCVLVSATSNHNQTRGCSPCHPGRRPLERWSVFREVHPSGFDLSFMCM